MNADLAAIPDSYDEACHLELPGGVQPMAMMPLTALDGAACQLPECAFTIEHQIGREDEGHAPRSAIRWGLHGTHDGWGSFGAPTGAGFMSWVSATPNSGQGLRREYVLFDETAIWKQIVMAG